MIGLRDTRNDVQRSLFQGFFKDFPRKICAESTTNWCILCSGSKPVIEFQSTLFYFDLNGNNACHVQYLHRKSRRHHVLWPLKTGGVYSVSGFYQEPGFAVRPRKVKLQGSTVSASSQYSKLSHFFFLPNTVLFSCVYCTSP